MKQSPPSAHSAPSQWSLHQQSNSAQSTGHSSPAQWLGSVALKFFLGPSLELTPAAMHCIYVHAASHSHDPNV